MQLSQQDMYLIQMSKIAKRMWIKVDDEELYGTDFKDSWINN